MATKSSYHNDDFVNYYTKIFQDDTEVLDSIEKFLEFAQKPLPISFRINFSSPYTRFKDLIFRESPTPINDIGWSDSIYQIDNISKYEFKRDDKWTKFRTLLIEGDNSGVLNRQELVSMLPVLFLNVQKGDKVLDICAAPGMKYLQILDKLADDTTGLVIGNDVSTSRLFTLGHRSAVLPSPSSCLTCSDGSRFANLYDDQGKKVYFDKILADVPCTCDGTLRKSPDIWKTWKPINSFHIHQMQYNILKKVIDLLTPGGILVYSTCSLNPIENEAIVSSLLYTGLITLVDCKVDVKNKCPTLVYSRGLKDWKVYYENQWYHTYDQVPLAFKRCNGGKIMPSMFKQCWSYEDAGKVMRIFPHQNNSGGFFIAKMKRCDYSLSLKVLSFNKRDLTNPSETIVNDANKVLHEYVPFDSFTPIAQFYKISSDFPHHLVFIKKACAKSLYLFSEPLAKICKGPYQLKWAHAGVKIFTKLDPKIAEGWRFCTQGITIISKFVNSRKLKISPKAAIYLISDKNTANEYKDSYDEWYKSSDIPVAPGGLILVTPGNILISAIINKNGVIYPYIPSPKLSVLEIIKQELDS